jgi:hypothetical protein
MLGTPKKKFDRVAYEWANGRNSDRLKWMRESLENYDTDKDSANRMKRGECKCCWYLNRPRMAGAAMTRSCCGICEREMVFGSTSTDSLCPECASRVGLCRHCGGDMKGKNRRKLDFSKPTL